jgi:hypothetical protein
MRRAVGGLDPSVLGFPCGSSSSRDTNERALGSAASKSSTRKNSSRPLPGGGSGRVAADAHGRPIDEGRAEQCHPRRGSDQSRRGREPIAAGQAASGTTRGREHVGSFSRSRGTWSRRLPRLMFCKLHFGDASVRRVFTLRQLTELRRHRTGWPRVISAASTCNKCARPNKLFYFQNFHAPFPDLAPIAPSG